MGDVSVKRAVAKAWAQVGLLGGRRAQSNDAEALSARLHTDRGRLDTAQDRCRIASARTYEPRRKQLAEARMVEVGAAIGSISSAQGSSVGVIVWVHPGEPGSFCVLGPSERDANRIAAVVYVRTTGSSAHPYFPKAAKDQIAVQLQAALSDRLPGRNVRVESGSGSAIEISVTFD